MGCAGSKAADSPGAGSVNRQEELPINSRRESQATTVSQPVSNHMSEEHEDIRSLQRTTGTFSQPVGRRVTRSSIDVGSVYRILDFPQRNQRKVVSKLWEDETLLREPTFDQIRIPEEIENYPPAVPPLDDENDIMLVKDINAADYLATKAKPDSFETLEDLVLSMTRHMASDVMKARVLFTWMGIQDIRGRAFPDNTEQGTPMHFLKMLSMHQMGYSTMYAMLCRAANLPCVIIRGVAKSAKYEVGDKSVDNLKNSWCAVYVQKGWRLVFPLWGLASVVGKSSGLWTLIETEAGGTRRKSEAALGFETNDMEEYYFFTNPKELAFVCHPDDKKWQLLKRPFSKKQFISVPFVHPEYFKQKLRITTPFHGILTAEEGQCAVGIKAKNTQTSFSYQLFFNHHESKQPLPEEITLENYVARVNIAAKETVFQMRFPLAGIYKLHILDNDQSWICFFKIICNQVMENVSPYPLIPDIGFGPCQETIEAGLSCDSHHRGVVHLIKNRNITMRFTMTKIISVQAILVHSNISSRQLKKNIMTEMVDKFLTLNVSNLTEDGEYAIQIFSKEYGGSQSYSNVCNYLLQSKKNRSRLWENAREKKARSRLMESLDNSNDPEKIQKALDDFLDLGLEDPEVVPRALDRIDYLIIFNALKQGILRRNLDILEHAIDKAISSKHQTALELKIQEAEAVAENLRQLKRFAHDVLEMNQKTVSEVHRYPIPKPVVFNVMKATFLLLGEKLRHIEYWEDIQALMRETGRRSLINRIRKFDSIGVEKDVAKLALDCLSPYDKNTATTGSCATGTFYVWAQQIGNHILGTK